MSRGYTNKNPGNIRKTNDYWLGEVSGSDPDFKTFSSMEWGYRAMFVLLKSYLSDGYNTINLIINRWAPSSENNTTAYINHVVQLTGFNANQVLTYEEQTMKKMVAALSQHENGITPNWTEIDGGWTLTGEVQTVKTVGISMAAIALFVSVGFVVFMLVKQN